MPDKNQQTSKTLNEAILEAVSGVESGVEPQVLLNSLTSQYQKANVIEALQYGIERGKISLNSQGMVTTRRLGAS